MSFSISDVRIIDRGSLIAKFNVTLTTDRFPNAVTFQARLLHGPHGYFALPINVRDQAGTWQRTFSFSQAFCKAICAAVLARLNLDAAWWPPYVAPEPNPLAAIDKDPFGDLEAAE
jgi:hypothetical protein